MFGQIHNNVRDAIEKSFNKPPMPKAKGLRKGVILPGPFGVFNNMPGAKARQPNALAKEAGQKAKATSSKFGFNDSQMIPGMASKPTTSRPQRPKPPSSSGGVNLMKGKWVKNPKSGISSWKPDGLGRDMTNEEYRYVRKEWMRTNDPNNDRFKAPKQPKPEFKWRTWEPEPGEFLY